ncbi:MAG: hypothetical protein MPK62_12670, partial [Alphaproteobacteria bacterium]|nr:hypothetical protein [Alphaproteobacteria bacterium]
VRVHGWFSCISNIIPHSSLVISTSILHSLIHLCSVTWLFVSAPDYLIVSDELNGHAQLYVPLFLLSCIKQITSLVPTTPIIAQLSTGPQLSTTFPAILYAQHSLLSQPVSMAMTSQALPTVYTTTHATVAPEMHSQGRLGHHSMYQHPEVVWGQHQMQQLAATQYQQQQQLSTSEAGPTGSSSSNPSPHCSSYRIDCPVAGMPQGVPSAPSLAQAHTQVQYANLLQQRLIQWYGMMLQGAMLGLHPSTMMTLEQYQAYQTALQGTQVQQLRQMEQTAQQPTTPEVGVAQQAVAHQTPPHLTSLQDSSVRQTPCQSVRSQLSAVDPPLQGAVQWLGICVEGLNY